jgi:hypothetical protein
MGSFKLRFNSAVYINISSTCIKQQYQDVDRSYIPSHTDLMPLMQIEDNKICLNLVCKKYHVAPKTIFQSAGMLYLTNCWFAEPRQTYRKDTKKSVKLLYIPETIIILLKKM